MHRLLCAERLGQADVSTASSENLLGSGAALVPRTLGELLAGDLQRVKDDERQRMIVAAKHLLAEAVKVLSTYRRPCCRAPRARRRRASHQAAARAARPARRRRARSGQCHDATSTALVVVRARACLRASADHRGDHGSRPTWAQASQPRDQASRARREQHRRNEKRDPMMAPARPHRTTSSWRSRARSPTPTWRVSRGWGTGRRRYLRR